MIVAWHGEPLLKKMALVRMREHQRQDRLRQRQWWIPSFNDVVSKTSSLNALAFGQHYEKGCQLGCLTQVDAIDYGNGEPYYGRSKTYEATERMFGINQKVASSLEHFFEWLTIDDAIKWAVESLEAIPVGADLSADFKEMLHVAYRDQQNSWPSQFCNESASCFLELLRSAPIVSETNQEAAQETIRSLTHDSVCLAR